MKKVKIAFILVSIFGPLIFLFQYNLANAKDPDYPTKPITYYISFGPGGTTDIAHRAFGAAAEKHLGQQFILINKAGASGALTAMAVMSAKPDGYTIGTTSASPVFTLPFQENPPYRDLSGFAMLANIGTFIYPLMVRDDAPWNTWKGFIEWARKNPRAAKIGITGAMEVSVQGYGLMKIEKLENVEFTCIPLKSSAEILTATLGGHITMFNSTTDPLTLSYLQEGKLRILAFMGLKTEKIKGYENIPSTEELYGFTIPKVFGIWGPRGLPDYVLKKLDDAFAKAIKDPEFVNIMNRMATPINYLNRDQMNEYTAEVYKLGYEFKKLREERAR